MRGDKAGNENLLTADDLVCLEVSSIVHHVCEALCSCSTASVRHCVRPTVHVLCDAYVPLCSCKVVSMSRIFCFTLGMSVLRYVFKGVVFHFVYFSPWLIRRIHASPPPGLCPTASSRGRVAPSRQCSTVPLIYRIRDKSMYQYVCVQT